MLEKMIAGRGNSTCTGPLKRLFLQASKERESCLALTVEHRSSKEADSEGPMTIITAGGRKAVSAVTAAQPRLWELRVREAGCTGRHPSAALVGLCGCWPQPLQPQISLVYSCLQTRNMEITYCFQQVNPGTCGQGSPASKGAGAQSRCYPAAAHWQRREMTGVSAGEHISR